MVQLEEGVMRALRNMIDYFHKDYRRLENIVYTTAFLVLLASLATMVFEMYPLVVW